VHGEPTPSRRLIQFSLRRKINGDIGALGNRAYKKGNAETIISEQTQFIRNRTAAAERRCGRDPIGDQYNFEMFTPVSQDKSRWNSGERRAGDNKNGRPKQ